MPWTMKPPELGRPAIAAIGLGLAALTAAVWLMSSGPEPAPVAPTPPPPPPPAAPVSAAVPAAPPPSAEGLRLFGLLGAGAIIGFPDGQQRLVAVGRDVLPGLKIARIEQQFVVLASSGGEVRLGFDGVREAETAASAAPASATAEAAQREETLNYRLGLAPRRAGSRVDGYVMRPGASLPALQRAGLQPGDVIVGVNGSRFDEERMEELAWQIANSDRTEFEVERGGRRFRLALAREQH